MLSTAVEDGRMLDFSMEMLQKLIDSRTETWADMMAALPARGYEMMKLREETGFTARIAVKKPKGAPRGILIVCAGGGFRFKSYVGRNSRGLAYLKRILILSAIPNYIFFNPFNAFLPCGI